ncbi:MAG: DNA-binding protein [Prevotellaceae bacterium]|nr:DNA-binding protein [Prevotellaceae bacterium]
MAKELTNTSVARQNILNNSLAMNEIQKVVGMKGILFENEYKFLKRQIADFFDVTERTIDNCIEKNEKELTKNGYEVLKGKRLVDLKLVKQYQFGHETDFATKTTVLGIFNFRAFLNVAMLLTDSEKAKQLRSIMLDIVIDTINKRTGGSTKYINQRDEDYIVNMMRGEDYRKEFTDALRDCVDMGNFKYMVYTDKIYTSIFKENAAEYRRILKLEKDENVRQTMYSEVLDIISSYEVGFSEQLTNRCKSLGRKLSSRETDILFSEFENQKLWEPIREKARNKMASRDLCFRDALHKNLEEYISAVPQADFDRFLGEKSMELDKRLEEYKEALKRLKDRE